MNFLSFQSYNEKKMKSSACGWKIRYPFFHGRAQMTIEVY